MSAFAAFLVPLLWKAAFGLFWAVVGWLAHRWFGVPLVVFSATAAPPAVVRLIRSGSPIGSTGVTAVYDDGSQPFGEMPRGDRRYSDAAAVGSLVIARPELFNVTLDFHPEFPSGPAQERT